MRKYLNNHVGVMQFLMVWATTPFSLTLIHFMTKTPLPWHECFRIAFPILSFISVVLFLLGLGTDKINRDRLSQEFLDKLESNIPMDYVSTVKQRFPQAHAKRAPKC